MAKEDAEFTSEERWVLQKRIANTLLPGETVGFLNPWGILFFSQVLRSLLRKENLSGVGIKSQVVYHFTKSPRSGL